MRKHISRLMITFMGIMSTFLLLPSGVTAQTSNLLPDQIEEIFDLFGEDGSGTASFISLSLIHIYSFITILIY